MKVLGHLVLGVIWRGNEMGSCYMICILTNATSFMMHANYSPADGGSSDSDEGSDMYAYRQTAW